MKIFEALWSHRPSGLVLLCAFLTWAIPFVVYKINDKLHQWGDPPWKQQSQDETDPAAAASNQKSPSS